MSPKIEEENDSFAEVTLCSLPAEVIYLIPARIMNTRKNIPMIEKRYFVIFMTTLMKSLLDVVLQYIPRAGPQVTAASASCAWNI